MARAGTAHVQLSDERGVLWGLCCFILARVIKYKHTLEAYCDINQCPGNNSFAEDLRMERSA